MAGDHFLDGFLAEQHKDAAKAVIIQALARLNDGEELSPQDLERDLAEYLA